MGFDELSEEQRARARACDSPEELMSPAKEKGYELTDDELKGLSGGGHGGKHKPPTMLASNDADDR